MLRCTLLLAAALTVSAVAGDASTAAQAPNISKPKPAPPGPSSMRPLTPAAIDNSLLIGGDDINGRQRETRMGVPVMVNGRGPYHFVVDSGADTSVVGLRVARDLQLPLGTPAILNGMSDRSIVDRVKVNALSFGPSTIRDLEVPALRESDLGGDGMLGIDALVRQRVMIDFEKNLVKVEDTRIPVKHLPGEIVVTGRLARGQLILTRVYAAGVRLDAVIDTGSEVTIGNSALRAKLLRHKPKSISKAHMIDVTGKSVDVELAVIPELELGPVTLHDVPIAFADVPPFTVFGLDQEPSLLLGTDLLATFRRVSLDFHARKARFQLRHCGYQPFHMDLAAEPVTMMVFSNNDLDVCARI